MGNTKAFQSLTASELRHLVVWFERQKRVLPWRSDPTPYRIWVSEIMLQQTQVATVIPFFERWMRAFPSVGALAEASEDEVLRHWSGLGYYSRARNLLKSARIIQTELHGRFPKTRRDWQALPGIGPYTSGAIASIAQNQYEPILDGNLERVFSRRFEMCSKSGFMDESLKKSLWQVSDATIKQAQKLSLESSSVNQGLMELGALICLPLRPQCRQCPLKRTCQAYQNQSWQVYPLKKKKKVWKKIEEQRHCLILSNGEILVYRDPTQPSQWRKGLFDLPEKLPNVHLKKPDHQLKTHHVVTNHKITRTTWIYRGDVLAKIPEGFKTVKPNQLDQIPHSAALKKTVQKVFLDFYSK